MKLDNNEFNGTSVIADQSSKQQEIVRSRDHRRTTAMLKKMIFKWIDYLESEKRRNKANTD